MGFIRCRASSFSFRALWSLQDFSIHRTSKSQRWWEPGNGVPGGLLRKRRRPTELNPTELNPFLGLCPPRAGPPRHRWAQGLAEGLAAGSAAQTRSAALLFLWGQLESLYKERVCAEVVLLAVDYRFRPCLVIFVLSFCFGMQMSLTSVCKCSYFKSHKYYLQPDS